MQEQIILSVQQEKELAKNSEKAFNFLTELQSPKILIHDRGLPRYCDDVLENFSYILDQKIYEKHKNIGINQKQIRELENPENRDRIDMSQSDSSSGINLLRERVKSDKKALEHYKKSRTYINHKSFGICFSTFTLIPIAELLSQPGRKTCVSVKKAEKALQEK